MILGTRMADINTVAIGLTGSFGSGCSTLREGLVDTGYNSIALSKYVREIWQAQNSTKKHEEAERIDLQTIGDNIRKKEGNGVLAKKAIEEINKETGKANLIVFDSIRNIEEVEELRKFTPNFTLIALTSSLEERWKRLRKGYEERGLNQGDFQADDARDANEDIVHGQQVRLCVDNADVILLNDKHFEPIHYRKEFLKNKVEPYINLVAGNDKRPPSPDEYMMAVAYTHALSSSCYKRQVGAVIHDGTGTILGVGCNNNPKPLEPCHTQWGECYRDIYKKELFEKMKKNMTCPQCSKPLKDNLSADYKCNSCNADMDSIFIPDKALSRCTASHAEEAAIINVGAKNLHGCTIYSTTFPCLLCMQKIIGSGIKKIVYCEPYPDPDATMILRAANDIFGPEQIEVYPFEGVKARAYFRVFGGWRREQERIVNEKRG